MKLFTTPAFWIVVAIFTLAAVVVLFRSRARHEWGFREAVQNPEQWSRNIERASRELERAIEEAKDWDESKVSAAVNRFVFDVSSSQQAPLDARVLKSMGPQVYPAVLQILADASKQEKLVKPTGENLLPEAPFNRACTLLGDAPPTNAAALVARFLGEPSEEIRKDAALVLGKIGTPEVISPLRKAFSDSDEYVRSYGLLGLQWAIKNRRLNEQCARDLYEDIAQLVLSGKNPNKSAALLLDIDPPRTTELFLSEKVFTANAPALHAALEALAEKHVKIPRDGLLNLIADLESGDLKYPKSRALAEALRLLGQHRLEQDRTFLEARTGSSDERVAEGAATGLIASFDLEGFEQRAWELMNKDGFSALKPAQKPYLAVMMFDGEVNNGGLFQYFFNPSGDYWPEALAGFEAMESKDCLGIIREAVGKFGKDGPHQDREQRQEQLAKLQRKSKAVFDSLDDRYYKSKEVLEVMAKRYVLKNPEAFR